MASESIAQLESEDMLLSLEMTRDLRVRKIQVEGDNE
ncbi:uncharacterized protein G2W53_042714 [Senna tora]|uniref:Uncharacterized protein n=1 Tax=Senna tora TaxID=362788 RepID=A0A834SGF3_9FABA|nr:uncharacterized protein G2W53_042714 [Senna tora]